MPHALLDAFDAFIAEAGHVRVDPPILQPAGLFLDLIGEDIRRRAFLTTDAEGRELCLRPDFTVPIARHHLDRGAAGTVTYAYRGPVFRRRPGESDEFLQAGLESFGRADVEAADADILADALAIAARLGVAAPEIRMGDVGLVAAFLDALRLPPHWRRRLDADLRRSRSLDADLDKLARARPNGAARHAGFLRALEGVDPDAARAAVADLLSIAGIRPVGGRTVDEIADRFLEQATLAEGGGLAAETITLLRRLFAVTGNPDAAAASLRALAAEAGLDLEPALDGFETRTGFMAAAGIDVAAIRFSTVFGRRLDYYTGFVFELHDPARPSVPHLVGGGRYDRLLTQLGAQGPVPAVGCSIWIDRFAKGAALA